MDVFIPRKWLVLVSAMLVAMLGFGFTFVLATIFSSMLEQFGESRSKTATLQALYMGVTQISTTFVGLFISKWGVYRGITCSAILMPIGFFAAFFANSMMYLYVSIGIVGGIGNGFIFLSSIVAVGQSFPDSQRALALSAMMTSLGIGTLFYPYFMQWLVNMYGLNGAFLVLSGLYLNTFVTSIVFHYETDIPKIINELEHENQIYADERRTSIRLSVLADIICSNVGLGAINDNKRSGVRSRRLSEPVLSISSCVDIDVLRERRSTSSCGRLPEINTDIDMFLVKLQLKTGQCNGAQLSEFTTDIDNTTGDKTIHTDDKDEPNRYINEGITYTQDRKPLKTVTGNYVSKFEGMNGSNIASNKKTTDETSHTDDRDASNGYVNKGITYKQETKTLKTDARYSVDKLERMNDSNIASNNGLSSPVYLLFAIASTLHVGAITGFLSVSQDVFLDKGLTKNETLVAFLVYNIVSVLARLTPGITALLGWSTMTVSLLATAICIPSQLVILCFSNRVAMMLGFGLMGASFGGYVASMATVSFELLGKDKQAIGYGIVCSGCGVLTAVFGPLFGGLRDVTGEYTSVLETTSCLHGLCVILIATCFVLKYLENRPKR